jgi:hypothetical protein
MLKSVTVYCCWYDLKYQWLLFYWDLEVKLFLFLIKYHIIKTYLIKPHAMKMYWGLEV